MKFSANIEGIEFKITIERDKVYKAHNPLNSFSLQDLEDIKDGIVAIYSIIVQSSKNNETLEHYTTGILLSSDESEIPEELEEILDDFGIVEHVLKHWKLNESSSLDPDWALPINK
ncbi:hypothetical protein A9Q84_02055 [Halobacteriovorax marinus]|uniref:Uncharacterized protein n=1 Tax=Halobacteriovorax marinus TaxID=97084 RepID=A0A1Y5FI14_9BACT|nr:hypothetical protein A9Q84_02055 [Halobacteriovorax marinus]